MSDNPTHLGSALLRIDADGEVEMLAYPGADIVAVDEEIVEWLERRVRVREETDPSEPSGPRSNSR